MVKAAAYTKPDAAETWLQGYRETMLDQQVADRVRRREDAISDAALRERKKIGCQGAPHCVNDTDIDPGQHKQTDQERKARPRN